MYNVDLIRRANDMSPQEVQEMLQVSVCESECVCVCPANTESPPGSIAPHDCKCLAGFENTAYEVASNLFKVPWYVQMRRGKLHFAAPSW